MSTLSPEGWIALSPYLDKALTLSETERAPLADGYMAVTERSNQLLSGHAGHR